MVRKIALNDLRTLKSFGLIFLLNIFLKEGSSNTTFMSKVQVVVIVASGVLFFARSFFSIFKQPINSLTASLNVHLGQVVDQVDLKGQKSPSSSKLQNKSKEPLSFSQSVGECRFFFQKVPI
jgi:hypothetical protein